MGQIQTSPLWVYRQKLEGAKGLDPGTRQDLSRMVFHVATLHDDLLTLFPQLGQVFVDSPLQKVQTQSPIVPPPLQFTVMQKAGISFVSITSPSSSAPPTPALYAQIIRNNPNLSQAPIHSVLQSASNSAFDGSSGVTTYDPSAQMFFAIPDANPHWRVSSSFDQVNFSPPTGSQEALLIP